MDQSQLMVKDLPVVFLSYGEPNAEENFSLLEEAGLPHLGRVQGVKGFDAAHKAASALAKILVPESLNFVTVDADNVVTSPWLWKLWLQDIEKVIPVPLDQSVVSFRAVNAVNAACYGNGGVKIWSHAFAERMHTHELTDSKVVDFCWEPNYFQVKNVASTTYPNGSALQALRAGYREGVKLILADKTSLSSIQLAQLMSVRHEVPNVRLNQWATLGLDTPFGVWCCLGTLVGITDALHYQEKARDCLVDYSAFHNLVLNEVCHRHRLNPNVEWSHKDPNFDLALKKMGEKLVQNSVIVSLPFSRGRSSFIKQAILANMTNSSRLEKE
jgi:hypothetical protein